MPKCEECPDEVVQREREGGRVGLERRAGTVDRHAGERRILHQLDDPRPCLLQPPVRIGPRLLVPEQVQHWFAGEQDLQLVG
jgi:hypothetical protein